MAETLDLVSQLLVVQRAALLWIFLAGVFHLLRKGPKQGQNTPAEGGQAYCKLFLSPFLVSCFYVSPDISHEGLICISSHSVYVGVPGKAAGDVHPKYLALVVTSRI